MSIRRFFFASVALLGLSGGAHAFDPESMTMTSRGSLPVILTVPHDGNDAIPGVHARLNGVTVRDVGTRELAEHTADHLEKLTGKRPYLVIAKFSRKYIDANRAEQDAVESSDALPAYRAYHSRIASFVTEVMQRSPGGAVLIDIHGQGYDPDTTFRGTRNGTTVKSLMAKFGKESIQGKDSLTGYLQGKGYRVFPAMEDGNVQENPRFNGGHTVYCYGNFAEERINAIQLEFGKRLRENPRFAEDLAHAIINFQQNYLTGSK